MPSSPLPPDPYVALGVSKDASLDQIRASHRKLVLKAHPDRFPAASPEEKQKKADEFHKIQQAYELLADDNERRKYDASVRLTEMKAEVMKEREAASARRHGRSPQGSQDYGNPYFTTKPHEARGNAIYEERIPRGVPKYDDDFFSSHYDSSPKYDDPYRSSPRARAEEFKTGSRRTSGRDHFDDLRRSDDLAEQKLREKKEKKAVKKETMKQYEATDKARDRTRRKDSETKTYYHSPRPDNFTDSEDTEDNTARYSSRRPEAAAAAPKRRSDEPKKSTRSARKSREDEHTDSDDVRSHHKYSRRAREAEEYMETMKRTTMRQSDERLPEAPSPPPAKEKVDVVKRSSARKTRDVSPRDSRSRKPPPEIVDPPQPVKSSSRRTEKDSRPKPAGLKSSESAPVNSDSHFGVKSATWESSMRPREPQMRRTNTADMEQPSSGRGRDRERASQETGKFRRELHTSPVAESHGDVVPESPATVTTRWQVHPESEDESKPRIIPIHPVRRSSRPRPERTYSREPSPPGTGSIRRSTNSRAPRGLSASMRSSTFTEPSKYERERYRDEPPSSPRVPTIARASTGRVGGSGGNADMLFGEVPVREPAARPSSMRTSTQTSFAMSDMSFSPTITRDSIIYGSPRESDRRDRDRERERDSDRENRYRARSPGDSGRESSSRKNSRPFVTREGNIGRHPPSKLQSVRAS